MPHPIDTVSPRPSDATFRQRAFSLIELAVVVAIIGILAAIAIPTFLGQREGAQDAQAKSALRNIAAEARALAAQQAAGFPDDLLAQVTGLEGLAAFPSELITELPLIEPSFTYEDGDTASEGPNNLSVGMPLEVAAGGDFDYTKVAFAALSESGTCWFLTDDLDRGIRYAKDSSDDAASLCYAGRIKLAADETDFDNEVWADPDPDGPIWFPVIDDTDWPDSNSNDIGAAPGEEEEPGGGGEEPGGEEPGGEEDPPAACEELVYASNLIEGNGGFEGGTGWMTAFGGELGDDEGPQDIPGDDAGWWTRADIDDMSVGLSSDNPRSGSSHLRLTSFSDLTAVTAHYAGGVSCDETLSYDFNEWWDGVPHGVRVSPGDEVTMSFWAEAAADVEDGWAVVFAYHEEDGSPITEDFVHWEQGGGPATYSLITTETSVAPADAYWMIPRLTMSYLSGPPVVLDIDDMSLVVEAP